MPILYRGLNRIPRKELFRPLLGNVYCEFIKILCLKAPRNYSASFGTDNFSILFLERPKRSIFMIYGFPDPVGSLIYGSKYAKLDVLWEPFKKYYFCRSQKSGSFCWHCWKRRGPTNDEDTSETNLKSLIWDQYLPENMKWKFGNDTKKLRN